MKTLSQVEPRTAISSLPYAITNSGSYYVTTNLTAVSGTNGITIAVENVTIDLNGFTLFGVAGAGDGIYSTITGSKNLSIINGALRNWGRYGVNLTNGSSGKVMDIRVSNNSGGGISIGSGFVLLRCVATQNTKYGIYSGAGCVIKDSTVEFNTGDGVTLGYDSTIVDSAIFGNTTNGLVTGSSCLIRGCAVNGNYSVGILTAGRCRVENCVASDNGDEGILCNDFTTIAHCSADGNNLDGISINGFSSVTDCTAIDNFGDGIYAAADFNRIESNYVAYNAGRGIHLHAVNTSIVIRNTAAGNTTADLPSAGSNIGPVQSPATATNPAANFSM